jgi:hypothetical protein
VWVRVVLQRVRFTYSKVPLLNINWLETPGDIGCSQYFATTVCFGPSSRLCREAMLVAVFQANVPHSSVISMKKDETLWDRSDI